MVLNAENDCKKLLLFLQTQWDYVTDYSQRGLFTKKLSFFSLI